MARQISRHLIVSLSVAALLFAAGCGGKKTKPEEGNGGVPTAASADENVTGDSDTGKAMGLKTVHFPYDSFTLDATNKGILDANASLLKENGNLKVQVEGHCDQRGGIQYNIALGEKRANAVRKFLEDKGVTEDRITVISFGKERPVDGSNSEEAYAKNRRANFVITSH